MADRHDMRAADQPDRRLQPDQPVDRRRAHDRAIGFGADRGCCKTRRDRRARPARRSARGPIERIGIADQPADRAPPTHRPGRADVRPFAEVGLAEDHRACRAQLRDHRRVAARHIVLERQAASGGRHRVGGLDIVLDQHRNAVQRSAHPPRPTLGVERLGLGQRVGIERDHAAQRRPLAVHRRDPREIRPDQIDTARRPRRHACLKLIDRAFLDRDGPGHRRHWHGGGGEQDSGDNLAHFQSPLA